jgi:hypothetical protein
MTGIRRDFGTVQNRTEQLNYVHVLSGRSDFKTENMKKLKTKYFKSQIMSLNKTDQQYKQERNDVQ